MAKQMRLGIPGVKINETCWNVLHTIADYALARTGLRCGKVEMTHRMMREWVPVSDQTILRCCAALSKGGMVLVTDNKLDNGGQTANSYEVTALGLEVLRQAEENSVRMQF